MYNVLCLSFVGNRHQPRTQCRLSTSSSAHRLPILCVGPKLPDTHSHATLVKRPPQKTPGRSPSRVVADYELIIANAPQRRSDLVSPEVKDEPAGESTEDPLW